MPHLLGTPLPPPSLLWSILLLLLLLLLLLCGKYLVYTRSAPEMHTVQHSMNSNFSSTSKKYAPGGLLLVMTAIRQHQLLVTAPSSKAHTGGLLTVTMAIRQHQVLITAPSSKAHTGGPLIVIVGIRQHQSLKTAPSSKAHYFTTVTNFLLSVLVSLPTNSDRY